MHAIPPCFHTPISVYGGHRIRHLPLGQARTGLGGALPLMFALLIGWCPLVAAQDAYHLDDPMVKVVPIASDQRESLLGIAIDGNGRIFVGGREALFVF